MQIGDPRMSHKLNLQQSYHGLCLNQCPHFILIFLVQYIGFPNNKQLLQAVQLKLKDMQPMNVLNFYLNLFKFLTSWMLDIFLCWMWISFTMTIACVGWSKSCTSKRLWHIQMKENRMRENIASYFILVWHMEGKIKIADKMKYTAHLVALRDLFMPHQLSLWCFFSISFYSLPIFSFQGGC